MPITTMGRFGLCYGPFWLYDGLFWITQWALLDNFLGYKICGAVLVGAVLAMGCFGIAPSTTVAAATVTTTIFRQQIMPQ